MHIRVGVLSYVLGYYATQPQELRTARLAAGGVETGPSQYLSLQQPQQQEQQQQQQQYRKAPLGAIPSSPTMMLAPLSSSPSSASAASGFVLGPGARSR
jgi:hypothetical protein